MHTQNLGFVCILHQNLFFIFFTRYFYRSSCMRYQVPGTLTSKNPIKKYFPGNRNCHWSFVSWDTRFRQEFCAEPVVCETIRVEGARAELQTQHGNEKRNYFFIFLNPLPSAPGGVRPCTQIVRTQGVSWL